MKVLVVGHTYMLRMNRLKFAEMVRLDPTVQITVVCPRTWPHTLYQIRAETAGAHEDGVIVQPLRAFMRRWESGYFYWWPDLVKVLQTTRPDIIQVEHGTWSLAYLQLILAKKCYVPEAKIGFFTWVNWPYRLGPRQWIEWFNLRNSDFAVTGNADAAKILRDKGFVGPIKVAPQVGVDPNMYTKQDSVALRKRLGLDGALVIGFVGRLSHEKGLLTLLKALSQMECNWRLLLVGRGEMEPTIRDTSLRMNIADRIIFAGSFSHLEVVPYMNAMDLLVLPSETQSNWREQFGRVLIEAMACEVPVIGSSCGEIPHMVDDAGFVFREGDAQDLASKMTALIDSSLREKAAKRGRQKVLCQYTQNSLALGLLNFYRNS